MPKNVGNAIHYSLLYVEAIEKRGNMTLDLRLYIIWNFPHSLADKD